MSIRQPPTGDQPAEPGPDSLPADGPSAAGAGTDGPSGTGPGDAGPGDAGPGGGFLDSVRNRALLVGLAVVAVVAVAVGALAMSGVFSDPATPEVTGPVAAPPGGAGGTPPAGASGAPNGGPQSGVPTVPASGAGGGHVVTGPVGSLTEATLDIVNSASVLTLTAADLGNDLYRVETPANGALVPKVDSNTGRVAVRLVPSGVPGSGAVTMSINSKVLWSLKLTGGAATETLSLGLTRIKTLDLAGGSGKIDVTLPPPAGTLTVTMSAGAGQMLVHLPARIPVRARISGGAGTVTVDGSAKQNVRPGTTISPAGWDAAANKYDVNTKAGVSALTIDRN